MELRLAIAVLGCASSIWLSPAHTAPVSYNEAVDGDISSYLPNFTLDVGTNTFSGTMALNSPIGTYDIDNFYFDVAPGNQVNSISYAFSNVNALPGSTGFGLLPEPFGGALLGVDVLNDVSPTSLLRDNVYLGTGTYAFGFATWQSATGGGTWDYTLTFEVGAASVVPVPAAAWLFGSGLLGLVGIIRHK